jgi:hypothetical protein
VTSDFFLHISAFTSKTKRRRKEKKEEKKGTGWFSSSYTEMEPDRADKVAIEGCGADKNHVEPSKRNRRKNEVIRRGS